MTNFISLVTNDYRLAFCQATRVLPENTQVQIWRMSLDIQPSMPKTPRKCEISPKMQQFMNRWSARN